MPSTQESPIPRTSWSCLVTPAFPKPLGAADHAGARSLSPGQVPPEAQLPRAHGGSQVPKERGRHPRPPPCCTLPCHRGKPHLPAPTRGLARLSRLSWRAEASAQRCSRCPGSCCAFIGPSLWRDAALSRSLEAWRWVSASLPVRVRALPVSCTPRPTSSLLGVLELSCAQHSGK